MSTRRCPAWQALRTRVSMSATGSVMLISCSVLLPTGFAHAGNLPAQRELAETNAAQPELPERPATAAAPLAPVRSEEHTSELQSRLHLVCRLLLEKKKKQKKTHSHERQPTS